MHDTTTDVRVLALKHDLSALRQPLLLVRMIARGTGPLAAHWELPGGPVAEAETPAEAAWRILRDEHGLLAGDFFSPLVISLPEVADITPQATDAAAVWMVHPLVITGCTGRAEIQHPGRFAHNSWIRPRAISRVKATARTLSLLQLYSDQLRCC